MSKARNIADLGSNDVLDTNANGVTVTGSLTADGLTVETTADNGAVIEAHDNLTTTYPLKVQNAAGTGRLEIGTYGINNNIDLKIQTADTNRINVDTNGDIIMYKDDGTTAGVTFDASTGYTTFDGYVTVNNSVDLNGTLFPNSIFMADSQAIVFGTGSDAELSWGGSYLNLNTKGNDIRIMDGLTTKVHYDASSNSLGIGTASPQAELHLHDPQGHAKIRLSGAASDADTFEIYQGITGVTNGGLTIHDVEASADRLVINSSGNVGIATNNPTAKLQVEGTFSVRSSSSQNFNDSNNANNLNMSDSKAHFNLDGTDKDFQVSSDNLSHALFVKGSDGRVGINHSSPSYPLDVNGVIQSDAGMYVRGDVTSSNYMIDAYNTDGGEDTKIGVRTSPNTSGDAFTFYDTGGSNMVVGNHWKGTTNNQLRIGTGSNVGTGFGGGLYIDGSGRTSVGTMLRVDNANYNGGSGGISVSGTHDNVRSAYIPWIYGASTTNRTYRHCFNITNGQAIEFYLDGGGGNTVWGTYGRIMVDHSYDYFIETNTLYYSDLKIKIVTDGNANLSVWVAGSSYQDNLYTFRWRVRPIHTWDCTITNNPTSSQSAGYIEHLASGGMQRSGGGSMNGGSGPTTTSF
jgi:hypothetical protein